jgi:hypothetical protein
MLVQGGLEFNSPSWMGSKTRSLRGSPWLRRVLVLELGCIILLADEESWSDDALSVLV